MESLFSPVITAATLHNALGSDGLLLVDVSAEQEFQSAHIPGAVQIDYSAFVTSRPPVMGLIPAADQLGLVLSSLGITPDTWVIAYDREGGGKAGRLLFTLDAIGHGRGSLLDGGLQAWTAAGYSTERGPHEVRHSHYIARPEETHVADKDYILSRLGADDVVFLDCRSHAEYAGQDVRAARGGRIPGAVNLNWTDTFDPDRAPQLLNETVLRSLLTSRGVTPDKEVIAYCQTHHRSSHTYMVLKQLGYTRLKGYPGAWSDWGNDPDTPVEN